MRNIHEYYRGYETGFKDGLNKALEHLVEQQKLNTENNIVIKIDDPETVKRFLTKEQF